MKSLIVEGFAQDVNCAVIILQQAPLVQALQNQLRTS